MMGGGESLDRDADAYEIAFHRKSALRGFLVGGVLLTVSMISYIATGVYFVGALAIPGALLITSAVTHRRKAQQLETALRSPAFTGPQGYAGAQGYAGGAQALGRGSRVAVRWADGRVYNGFVLETRAGSVLVQFEGGRQDWAPAHSVSAVA